MHQTIRWALGMVIVLTLTTGEVQAQYSGGWGGWSGGTVQGNIARGAGLYDLGAGVSNQDAAAAAAMNEDTIMRWNRFMFQSQQEANRRAYLRRARRMQRDAGSGSAIYKRVRDHPDEHDIEDGDALNVILDQLTHPRIQGAVRKIHDPISGKTIREIPFESASEAVTISLHQLTGEGGWPVALQGEAFAAERTAYQEAIGKAVKEVEEEGTISPGTLDALTLAASRLRAKLDANRPAKGADYAEAANLTKALVAMSRMLEKPRVEKILAELDKVKETTLGNLLAFMYAYNLRFGPATTEDQRSVYKNLYAIMVAARDQVLKGAGADEDDAPVARGDRRHPVDFFQGVHLEPAEGRSTSDQAKP